MTTLAAPATIGVGATVIFPDGSSTTVDANSQISCPDNFVGAMLNTGFTYAALDPDNTSAATSSAASSAKSAGLADSQSRSSAVSAGLADSLSRSAAVSAGLADSISRSCITSGSV